MNRKQAILISLITLLLYPAAALPGEQALSPGYGFAAYNLDKQIGKIEGGKYLDLIRGAYLYERPVHREKVSFLVESYAAHFNRPAESIAESGLGASLRYYPVRTDEGGFFLFGGPGIAYTTIGFKEEGSQLLFIMQGGIGYRYKSFFIEDRIRHYPTGGAANPNRPVSSNILSIGFYY